MLGWCADRGRRRVRPPGYPSSTEAQASIWQADDVERHLSATDQNLTAANPATILYGQIDPALYANEQKTTLLRLVPNCVANSPSSRCPLIRRRPGNRT